MRSKSHVIFLSILFILALFPILLRIEAINSSKDPYEPLQHDPPINVDVSNLLMNESIGNFDYINVNEFLDNIAIQEQSVLELTISYNVTEISNCTLVLEEVFGDQGRVDELTNVSGFFTTQKRWMSPNGGPTLRLRDSDQLSFVNLSIHFSISGEKYGGGYWGDGLGKAIIYGFLILFDIIAFLIVLTIYLMLNRKEIKRITIKYLFRK